MSKFTKPHPGYIFPNHVSLEDIKEELKKVTIFTYIEASRYRGSLHSNESISAKIKDLRTRQVPEREVLLDLDDEVVAEGWFKNWLHPDLPHLIQPSPKDKRGCSPEVLKRDSERDMLHYYECGQQNFDYTLKDVEEWLGSQPKDCS